MVGTGFVGIDFKAGVTDAKMAEIIAGLCKDNEGSISRMWFLEVVDDKAYDIVEKNIEKEYRT